MNFIIKWTLDSKALLHVERKTLLHQEYDRILDLTGSAESDQCREYKVNDELIYVLGDIVSNRNEPLTPEILLSAVHNNSVHTYGGFFYLIHVSAGRQIRVFSGLFNILPIYYCQKNGIVFVSSSSKLLRTYTAFPPELDKQFLLEMVLFNYSLFNRTYWKNIQLIPANHYLYLHDKFEQVEVVDIRAFYTETPGNGGKVIAANAEFFINQVKYYFPDEPFALSFTGGFDGRTLLATALYYNQPVCATAFGTYDSEDLMVPLQQAKELGIEFLPVYLEEEYIRQNSYSDALNLIEYTEGNASLSRSHYLYAARFIAKRFRILVTGNFGSEIFRAAHQAGAVISQEMFDIIRNRTFGNILNVLTTSTKLDYLNRSFFRHEIDNVADDLTQYFKSYSDFSNSKMIYHYSLTEMLRKYFGPEIIMQRRFLSNRAPFLDFFFLRQILSTNYCGAYGDYATHNKFKRFKGQITYSYIIQKTYPKLLKLPTTKGYNPAALLSVWGKARLVHNLMKSSLGLVQPLCSDPYCVERAFHHNQGKYRSFEIDDRLFNAKMVRQLLDSTHNATDKRLLRIIITASWYINREGFELH